MLQNPYELVDSAQESESVNSHQDPEDEDEDSEDEDEDSQDDDNYSEEEEVKLHPMQKQNPSSKGPFQAIMSKRNISGETLPHTMLHVSPAL